jgi:hypothetical protein
MGDDMATIETAISSIDDALFKLNSVKTKLTELVVIDNNNSTMDGFKDYIDGLIKHLEQDKIDLKANKSTIDNSRSGLGL